MPRMIRTLINALISRLRPNQFKAIRARLMEAEQAAH
jgi:hypothetical protein